MGKLWLRNLIVAGAVGLLTALGMIGFLGDLNHSRVRQWQAVVKPRVAGGYEVSYWIDIDRWNDHTDGWRLTFDNQLGPVQDVTVRAPDGTVSNSEAVNTGVPIGDLRQVSAGVYRYEVDYALPEAPTQPGDDLVIELPLDAPVVLDSLDVELVGIELSQPFCRIDTPDHTRVCGVSRSEGGHTIREFNIPAHSTLKINGEIVDTFEGSTPKIAPPPARYEYSDKGPVAKAIGAATLLGVFLAQRVRRPRRNPAVGGRNPAVLNVASRKSDSESGEDRSVTRSMPAPPTGVAPWEARVLLTERFDRAEVYSAYLAGLIGQGAVAARPNVSSLAIRPGPRFSDAAPADRQNIDVIVAASKQATRTDPRTIEKVRDQVVDDLSRRLDDRGWWNRDTPAPSQSWRSSLRGPQRLHILAAASALAFASLLILVQRDAAIGVLVACFVFGVVLSLIVYRTDRPERSRAGTSAAHHSEAFRRYLHSATASDVEAAVRAGVAREYSGWAVGLGEAAAWSAAIDEAAHARPSVIDEVSEPLAVAGRV